MNTSTNKYLIPRKNKSPRINKYLIPRRNDTTRMNTTRRVNKYLIKKPQTSYISSPSYSYQSISSPSEHLSPPSPSYPMSPSYTPSPSYAPQSPTPTENFNENDPYDSEVTQLQRSTPSHVITIDIDSSNEWESDEEIEDETEAHYVHTMVNQPPDKTLVDLEYKAHIEPFEKIVPLQNAVPPSTCCICLDEIRKECLFTTWCNHTYHQLCFFRWIYVENKKTCVSCRSLKRPYQ